MSFYMARVNLSVLTAFLTGVGLHHGVFKHGEWDFDAPSILKAYAILELCLVIYARLQIPLSQGLAIVPTLLTVTKLSAIFTAGLVSSILIYRGFFHRLRSFPGPYGARFSMWYHTCLLAKHPDCFNVIQQLHKEHGDFVRTGPCEISINHPEAISAVHSATSQCYKAPWYGIGRPYESLFAVREKDEHIKRRKVWDMAFRSNSLRDYDVGLRACTKDLLVNLEKHQGTPMNMTRWFNCLSFDVTGSLAFGESFDTAQTGDPHYIVDTLHESRLPAILGNLVWLVSIMKTLPGFDSQVKLFIGFAEDEISKAKQKKQDDTHVFSWIWKDYLMGSQSRQALMNLTSDASLIVFAGSDGIALILTGAFYFLSSHFEQLHKLQTELDALNDPNLESETLAKLPHLNAFINETLRLHYSGPSGFPRKTPRQGMYVGKTYIPADITVKVPFHTLFRDERNFKDAEKFIPERWTTRRDLVVNPGAFMPFLMGAYSCVGKQFALMELRYVIAAIVSRYHVCFAPGQTAEAYWDARKDGYAMTIGSLELVFTARD